MTAANVEYHILLLKHIAGLVRRHLYDAVYSVPENSDHPVGKKGNRCRSIIIAVLIEDRPDTPCLRDMDSPSAW